MKSGHPPRVLLLDGEDHVLRILRWILLGQESDPRLHAWFSPDRVDLTGLLADCRGLREPDGAVVMEPGHPLESEADIVIFRRSILDREWLDRHPRLRLVQRLGSRCDGIDLEEARRRGAAVSCLPRRTLAWTAEHVLLLALAWGKRLLSADQALRAGVGAGHPCADGVITNWTGLSGIRGLSGSTIGIVGLGEVGTIVARLGAAFGMQVLYHKPQPLAQAAEAALGVRYVPLDELLARADFVSLNLADHPDKVGFADARFFAGMKRSAFFINTSRGRLVDEDALYAALASGSIAGAGLDVHAREPRAGNDRFCRLPNVVLTPHIAGGSRSGVLDEFSVMARNGKAALKGLAVEYAV